MNFNDFTFQAPSYVPPFDMAENSLDQNSNATQYIQLGRTGTPAFNQCVKNYAKEERSYPSCAKNTGSTMEYSKHQTMICLTELRQQTNDHNLQLNQELPRKRFRTTFSPAQLKRLESEFHCNMYVVGLKRLRLAQELKLEERHVKIWFQNRRMKFKRDQRLIERNSLAYQNYHCFY